MHATAYWKKLHVGRMHKVCEQQMSAARSQCTQTSVDACIAWKGDEADVPRSPDALWRAKVVELRQQFDKIRHLQKTRSIKSFFTRTLSSGWFHVLLDI